MGDAFTLELIVTDVELGADWGANRNCNFFLASPLSTAGVSALLARAVRNAIAGSIDCVTVGEWGSITSSARHPWRMRIVAYRRIH